MSTASCRNRTADCSGSYGLACWPSTSTTAMRPASRASPTDSRQPSGSRSSAHCCTRRTIVSTCHRFPPTWECTVCVSPYGHLYAMLSACEPAERAASRDGDDSVDAAGAVSDPEARRSGRPLRRSRSSFIVRPRKGSIRAGLRQMPPAPRSSTSRWRAARSVLSSGFAVEEPVSTRFLNSDQIHAQGGSCRLHRTMLSVEALVHNRCWRSSPCVAVPLPSLCLGRLLPCPAESGRSVCQRLCPFRV